MCVRGDLRGGVCGGGSKGWGVWGGGDLKLILGPPGPSRWTLRPQCGRLLGPFFDKSISRNVD